MSRTYQVYSARSSCKEFWCFSEFLHKVRFNLLVPKKKKKIVNKDKNFDEIDIAPTFGCNSEFNFKSVSINILD